MSSVQPLTLAPGQRPAITDCNASVRLRVRFGCVVAGLCVSLTVMLLVSLQLGAVPLRLHQVSSGLIGGGDALHDALIWNLRLPRSLLAAAVGLHFAVSGLILQAVIRNPLADPGVIGISSGASLTAVILLLLTDLINIGLQDPARHISIAWLPFAALSGGLATAGLVLGLSWGGRLSPARLALNGVAIGALLHALVMWVVVVWGGARTEIALIWLAGSLYGRDFNHLLALLPWSALGLCGTVMLLRPLSLLRFDDGTGQAIGLSVRRWRFVAIAVAVMLAASAIAVAGPVGFVGLVVPHLARLLVGGDMRRQLVTCALCGAFLTLAADTVARTAISPLELPVGVLTTLIGIPVFLVLLQRQTRLKP